MRREKIFGTILLSWFIVLSTLGQKLSIEGGYLVNTGSVTLSDNIGLNVDGIMNNKGGSQINFYGNSLQSIEGSSSPFFSNMHLNNNSLGLQLYTNISLNGSLNMTDGDLDLLDQTLTLGLNGVIMGENANSRIKATDGSGDYSHQQDAGTGQIIRTINISSSGVNNAAGLGIDLNPNSNWGSTSISRGHQRQVGFDGDNSVFRRYIISPSNALDLSASISISYNPNELNGYNAGSLKMYQLVDNGAKGTQWQELSSTDNGSSVSATTIDNDDNQIIITLANTDKTLPVDLLDFEAFCNNGSVLLQWHTSSEVNNDYFIVEKSFDGIHFETIAQVNGKGNSNTLQAYDLLDYNQGGNLSYYRLTQVDFDGKKESFKVITSTCGQKINPEFSIQNPVTHSMIIRTSEFLLEQVDLEIYDIHGERVLKVPLCRNQSFWQVNLQYLSTGTYFLRLIYQGKTENFKLLKL
jgi:hypothetical protein